MERILNFAHFYMQNVAQAFFGVLKFALPDHHV